MPLFRWTLGLVALAGLTGGAQAADSRKANPVPADGTECGSYEACVVPGAEVEDADMAARRAKTGSGPQSGLVSDKRLKSELTEVGKLENGLKVYAFKYLWETQVRVGVLAQDLLERKDTKHAVLRLANGVLGVDYAALGLRMAVYDEWRQHGLAALRADYKPQGRRSARLTDPVKLNNGPR